MKLTGIFAGVSLTALTACNAVTDPGLSTASTSAGTAAQTPASSALVTSDPALSMSADTIRALYSNVACDSLGGVSGHITSSYDNGLRGFITVPNPGVNPTQFSSLSAFENTSIAQVLPNELYLSQVNVPTRMFTEGFPTMDGSLILGPTGAPLLEWFRIDLDGFIQLPSTMNTGDYEFAMIADDGATLSLGADFQQYASSPTEQQSKLICGNSSVTMVQGQTLPMKLNYFQGPRYNIALMLLWRPASATAEPLCGQSGNNLWFDPSQTPPTPQPAYTALQSRGWSVVPPDAFRIPDDVLLNPCQSVPVQQVFGCTAATCGGTGI